LPDIAPTTNPELITTAKFELPDEHVVEAATLTLPAVAVAVHEVVIELVL
jgi:hypothetical protein